ncbi:benomyl/methotrexate resistance protein [Colletotrichum paranaense]|uniref:Benomyl/methotrexate resistance protein n=1 Tax=Colletotrichum paranaense TaxID=1914294 RepID=A0ABQ9SN26_9PEZI|nr:benomyl/methotrexate resistance protein [Colletotrichum paranaense]KAK1540915.1 benomyl/methotrexate resistance protein [Colletotrichum paranaense]
MPIIGSAWFSIGSFLLFNSVVNYLPDAYPNVAASALAGNDFFRSVFGAGFPLFANEMYTKLGAAWASSLLGFLPILFIPIPIILYKVSRHKSAKWFAISLIADTGRSEALQRVQQTCAEEYLE